MKYAELIMVTDHNNNKYIKMEEQADGTFAITTGRVDLTAITQNPKPIRTWDSYYRSKVRKGYVDVTSGEVPTTKTTFKQALGSAHAFLNWLQQKASHKVAATYQLSPEQITQFQVETAQNYLNELRQAQTVDEANNILLKVFTFLPRRMSKVQDHLISDLNGLPDKIQDEQDNLDALSSQVSMNEPVADITLADHLGITISEVTDDELELIKNLAGNEKIAAAYAITNHKTEARFKNVGIEQTTKLWHSSGTGNWISILQKGLKIFPKSTNGRSLGNGLYFAPNIKKSLQYATEVLGIFEVQTGEVHYGSNSSFANSAPDNKNSVWYKRFNGLDEVVVYDEAQATIRYIVHLSK